MKRLDEKTLQWVCERLRADGPHVSRFAGPMAWDIMARAIESELPELAKSKEGSE